MRLLPPLDPLSGQAGLDWGVCTHEQTKSATHFIAATLTEVDHHGTQIGALRDLYAWRQIDRRQQGDLIGSPAQSAGVPFLLHQDLSNDAKVARSRH